MKYRGDFEYVPFPEFVKSWESFAGKPYVKPGKNTGLRTRKTGEIAGTVREAQELQVGLNYHGCVRDFDYRCSRYFRGDPTTYPQSLGELCIELAQDSIRNAYYAVDVAWPGLCNSYPFRRDTSRDIQNLRTLMYYKRKNHFVGDSVYDNTEYLQAWVDGLNNAGGTTVTTNCYMFAGYPY